MIEGSAASIAENQQDLTGCLMMLAIVDMLLGPDGIDMCRPDISPNSAKVGWMFW